MPCMKYNLILMSQAYERFAKRRNQAKKTPARYNLQKISFDDSVDSSRSDIPNFFIGDKSEAEIPSILMREKERKKNPPIAKHESLQELKPKRVASPVSTSKKREQVSSLNRSQIEVEDEQQQQQIPEPEVEMEPHTSLSLFQLMKLNLGQYLFRDPFPMKKAIYINNNNDQENQLNKKEFQVKFKNDQKEVSHLDNSLTVSVSLFAIALILRNVFAYFYIYAWIAIIVLQSIAQNNFLNGPIQYGTQTKGLIVLVVIAVVMQLVADWLSLRKRGGWQENRISYKVYHHNGKMAEWVNIKAHQIKPGHLFKVVPGECAPTDCVLVHSERSLVHIKENHITSCLVEPPSQTVIKETLLKGQNINLPLSGSLTYEISNPEYSDFQIIGKLNLEEPHEVSHPISMSQVILRGSINFSDKEILCLAMQTGIDSLLLKNLQYPFQQRKVYEQSAQAKAKVVSDQTSQEIKEKQGVLLNVPMEKRFQSAVFFFIFLYLLLSGVGVLTNFLFKLTKSNEYYLSSAAIPAMNIVVYHLTNFIIFVPVLLLPIFKLFVTLSGSIAEWNITKRTIDLIPQNDKQRRTGSFSGEQNEALLDNKKIIFPVKIKDHNILHQLTSVDTLITTIDTFRNESAFTLHSIKVKGIAHNFATTPLDSQIYSTEAVEYIRTFMSSAVLTTCRPQSSASSFHYDDGIEFAARKYLDLKKVKNAYGEYLISNNDQFKVKHLFTIIATTEYPYQVVFLQPVGGDMDENPEILVLIRGDTKTILDKTYGKQIDLTVQSRKLHEEKDYYVQLLAKTAVKLTDAQQIHRAYHSNSIEKAFFYRNLDKFISRVQPMGLLIFNNNFFQKKIGQTIRNPLLNKSIITQYKVNKTQNYDSDILASQHLPNLIILAPPSKSTQPEFQSIHTIKSLLTNSNLFNFTLSQVGDKILHQKPSNLQIMMQQIQAQKVMVWNGWDQKDITYTIDILKKYGQEVMLYIEKDEYMYLMKECDCAVKGSNLGYDSNKYSDITLSSRSSISFFYLTQLIKYDAVVVKQGLLSLFFTQVAKFTFYFVIQFINLFYTRGTGLAIIRTPLYLVVEVVLLFDIFYYLNWKDTMRAQTFNKKEHFLLQLLVRVLHSVFQAIFVTLVTLYSLESPPDSSGTSHSYHFPYFIIVFSFLHILIFEKIFNVITFSFSIYKTIIIVTQIVVLYAGFIIVTLTDTYGYYGIVWNALIGKSFITAVCCIWIGLTLPAIRLLLQVMSRARKLKRGDQAKKTF